MIAPVDTFGERVEHKTIEPSIDEVPRDTEMSIVEGVTSTIEVSIDEVSEVVTEFSGCWAWNPPPRHVLGLKF